MSRFSPASSPLHLSSPAPSHLSSPTEYPTYQHSITPSNTVLTLKHPHSHKADVTQSSHITPPSLSISHHPTALSSFKQQTCKLQHPLHFLPLHFTITAPPLHDHRFKSTAHMLHTKRSLKTHHTHHLTYQFTSLQSQHPLYQPHPFHFHLDKHRRQSKDDENDN